MNPHVTYKQYHTYGSPLSYIRIGDRKISIFDAHREIVRTLTAAYDSSKHKSLISQLRDRFDLDDSVCTELDFINWGNMALIYLATLNCGSRSLKLTTLINQPHMPKDRMQREFENLQRLVEVDQRFVVEPYAHFTGQTHEVYVSEYVDKARCVYSGRGYPWGMFDPKPHYHFEIFSEPITHAVTSAMIALLVHYHRDGKGIAKTQLSGDDFILAQDWDKKDPSTVLAHMRLIAARDLIEVSLDEYIEMLRTEFLVGTHYKDHAVCCGEIRVNHKSGLPITKRAIDEGIEMGLRLRQS